MKTNTIILFLLLLVQQAGAQPAQLRLSEIPPYMYPNEVAVYAGFFRDRFQTKKGKFDDDIYDSLQVQDLYDMEHTVLTEHNQDAGVTDANFFHVLRIFYGLDTTTNAAMNDTSYNIRLIFLPDRAIRIGTTNQFDFEIDYPLQPEQQVYLSGDITTPVAYSSVSQYVENYKRAGYMKLDTIGFGKPDNMRHLQFSDDSASDAAGIAFPMQELHDYFPTGKIYFYNIAEIDAAHRLKFYKHRIAISNSMPGDLASAVCSNLGALCPPRCNDIKINSKLNHIDQSFLIPFHLGAPKGDRIFLKWKTAVEEELRNNPMKINP